MGTSSTSKTESKLPDSATVATGATTAVKHSDSSVATLSAESTDATKITTGKSEEKLPVKLGAAPAKQDVAPSKADVVVKEGAEIILEQKFVVSPKAAEWTKDGKLIVGSQKYKKSVIDKTAQLIISGAEATDSGVYNVSVGR